MFGWLTSPGPATRHQPRKATYEGFVACSDRDDVWADKLTQQLERYYAGKPGAGTHHFFRASKDESAKYALAQTTIGALEASRSLIVICSPAAAKSYQVNEQIRAFKAQHPTRPVFPLIVDGKAGDEERECIPPLLKFEMDADGNITKGPVDVEAADVSQDKDEPERAAATIASDLLGLSPRKTARIGARGKKRVRNQRLGPLMNLGIVAGLTAIAVLSGSPNNKAFFARTFDLVDANVGEPARKAIADAAPQTTAVNVFAYGESLLWDVMKRGPLTPETKYRRAAVLLQFAHTYRELGDTERAVLAAADAQHLLHSLRNAEPSNADFVRRLEIADDDLAKIRAEEKRATDIPDGKEPLSKLTE
ncbi:TIR domain-containing protein [Methyloceanibacter caenitepidi]|uniref:TIR domain-containing protein n=1 Tax=Methyloceanibacter caenitepidi TaxID=1384459 RepID=UPI000694F95E|nr:TIR domain-containing protein [Methyloceanibacter caenitepidi]